MNLTPPAPPARPSPPEPERSTLPTPKRPIAIKHNPFYDPDCGCSDCERQRGPVERIIERQPIIIEREPCTEPVPVAPIVERETIIIERTPDALPSPVAPRTQKERTDDPVQQPTRDRPDAPRPATPDGARGAAPEQKEFAEPNKKSSPEPAQRVRKPDEKSSPINSESIRQTIPNNSEPELIPPDKPAPQAAFKKVGKVGRQRRYDELGIDDIEPIRDVFLFQHHMGRPWPGLSKDMIDYYEKFYFTKPNKRKDGKDYDKHVKCWQRRERWLTELTGQASAETESLGDSANVVDFTKRAASHG